MIVNILTLPIWRGFYFNYKYFIYLKKGLIFAELDCFRHQLLCFIKFMRSILTIFLLSFSFVLFAQKDYVSVKAKSGDGIYVLLGRYGLDRGSCNFDLFCKLNDLTLKSQLIADKNYYLPIERHKFDGSSLQSSLGINDNSIISQIDRYNRSMLSFRLKLDDYRSGKREIWLPHHFLACMKKEDVHIPQDRHFKILGKNYADVPLESKELAGSVFYVVSGHGGPDPGAMANVSGKQICEDEYAYDIALRLGRNLIKKGAIVHFITQDKDGIREAEILKCDNDETVIGDKTIPLDQKQRLNQRSETINQLYKNYLNKGINYQRTIEIHVDSRKKSERVDLFFYYYPQSSVGKDLAQEMHRTIKNKYARYRKGVEYTGTVSSRDLHVLREVIPTPVFVEVANIQNSFDLQRILSPKNRQLLADWLAEGLMNDY